MAAVGHEATPQVSERQQAAGLKTTSADHKRSQAESHGMVSERLSQIGMSCRVKLDIYKVG